MSYAMQPPIAAQTAFLEGLQSIGEAEFAKALALLQPKDVAEPRALATTTATTTTTPEGLLLKDATLEDIIAHLHAMNIEPTFRHLLKR